MDMMTLAALLIGGSAVLALIAGTLIYRMGHAAGRRAEHERVAAEKLREGIEEIQNRLVAQVRANVGHCTRAKGHTGPCNGWPCDHFRRRLGKGLL